MPKLTMVSCVLLFAIPAGLAQAPANEHNCPNPTAIPPYVGSGTGVFSPNQNLCLPQLAPTPTGLSPLAFIVRGLEPGDRVDSQGTAYVVSIRGVPGGIDLWRWFQTSDGAPNPDKTLPFQYEGQPDNCGIFSFTNGGCANNVGNPTNLGVAPGGGDADIAVNAPFLGVPNLAITSLALVPGVTATHSTDRGDNSSVPNPVAALLPGDDRQWQDAIDASTVYLEYHDITTFNIEVQRSSDGGVTYVNGFGEAIDTTTLPAVVGAAVTPPTGNVAGQTRIDKSSCPSRGNLYQIFVGPDSMAENVAGAPPRTVYVGVSNDAKLGMSAFMFTDHKIFTSPTTSPGATFGTANLFPALATDDLGYVYAVWSDNTNILYSSSSDQGTTWTTPVRVNSGATVGKANVFPWVAADANGHVVVVWLGDNLVGNSNDRTVLEKSCSDGTNRCWAKWNVYMAETVTGHALVPAFTQYTASDHIIHSGTVSTGGLGGGADRSLADFFQVALDPQHRGNISFADDHLASPQCTSQSPGHCADNDPQSFRTGQPYFTYQLTPNPKIVTAGACATTPPQPPGFEKITGGGHIPSGQPGVTAKFGLVAQNKQPNASLSYHDDGAPGGPIDVHSSNTSVPTVTFSGNCAEFKGDAKVNQQLGYTYTVDACDNSEPGTGQDTFGITVSGPNFFYNNSGKLTDANIQIHTQ